MFHQRQWILITLLIMLPVLPACSSAGEATPTPVSSISGLPLPTEGPDEILAVVVTPTPSAAEETTETTIEATEAADAGEGEQMTPEPNTEAVEAALTEEETADATAQPTGEAAGDEDGEEATLSEEERINRGEEIYATECAKCHQLNGRGRGEAFPALTGSDVVTAEDPAPAIEIVLNGREAMPSFKDTLSAQEIASVLSYVRNAWDNNASAVTTEHVQQVQASGGSESETAQGQ